MPKQPSATQRRLHAECEFADHNRRKEEEQPVSCDLDWCCDDRQPFQTHRVAVAHFIQMGHSGASDALAHIHACCSPKSVTGLGAHMESWWKGRCRALFSELTHG